MTRRLWLLIAVIALALGLRIYHLAQVPVSLYYDEVDYGYQARSLIATGHDYRGELSPFFVHSFNDIRTPIPAYLMVPTTLFTHTPEIQVRLPFAILGTLTTALAFLLMYTWTKHYSLALTTAVVFVFSPWQLQFSRFSHEVTTLAPFFLLGLILFFRFLASHRFLQFLAAVLFIATTTYTYRTMSLFAPLTLVLLTVLYYRPVLALGGKKLILAGLVAATLILPFLYFTTKGAPDTPRIQQLAITSDPEVPIWVQRHREVDSSDFNSPVIGKTATWWSYFFHNKPLSWTTKFVNNYLHVFSTDFLFLQGDPNPRHSISGRGELYLMDVAAVFVGLVFLLQRFHTPARRWLTIWLFLAPIPAALTSDGTAHAARLFIFSLPLLFTVSLGWWQIMTRLSHRVWPAVGLVWILSVGFYFHRYYTHYPIESSRWWGYGFKQSFQDIAQLQSQFSRVVMTPTKDPPIPYLLFWSHIPPKLAQEYGTNFSSSHPGVLTKYVVQDNIKITTLKPDTLYLVSTTEFPVDYRDPSKIPPSITLHSIIKYPDNEIAFYLLSLKK